MGTMMYETKKQQCQKTIEKKDNKLREINEVSFTNSSKKSQYFKRAKLYWVLNNRGLIAYRLSRYVVQHKCWSLKLYKGNARDIGKTR